MMRQMRENTKWIMLITAIAFVGLMVFEWGMDMSGRSSTNVAGGEIGRVNGEPISYDEFNRIYRNLYQQQQQEIDGPITGALNRQIEDAAWEQLVMQRLIRQELVRRGIVVTDAEIRQAARFSPPAEFMDNEMFLTDGEFDLQKYHQFLASPLVDSELLRQLESYYREVIPRTKLYYNATAGSYVSDAALWQMYRDMTEQVAVRHISIEPRSIVDDAEVTITDAEIRDYYRANPDRFRRDARASIRYVVIDRTASAADSAAALERATRVREEIAAGADFGEVARRESADAVSARDDGELTVRRGETVPPFEEAVFSLPIGQLSEPILTQFGYHVIRVDSRTDDEARARHILIGIELGADSEDRVFERADSLERLGERLPLQQAADALDLRVRTGELTTGMPFLLDVGLVSEATAWALDEAEVGEVSPLFETEDAYYMAELVAREQAGMVPLQEASPQIRTMLATRKRIELAKAKVAEPLRAGATLESVAATFGASIEQTEPFSRGEHVPGLGQINAAIGAAFGLQRPGQLSAPVEAMGFVHVLELVSRVDADRATWEAQKEEQRMQVVPVVAQQRWNQFLAALHEEATIIDNRAQLLRRTAPSPLAQF
jgi:peptidyl-prolyl cis-trans isomerase D